MKQLVIILSFILGLNPVFGQITLEQTYDHSGTFISLSVSGEKFYVMDVGASQCRIYNTDHTLWKTINLSVPTDHYLYDIRYVSENLFTDDNSLCLFYIYYNFNEVGQYYTYTAKIVQENGTELLTIPGCNYNYVYNMADGTTKMTTYSYDYSVYPYPIQTRVYELPGHLISFSAEEMTPTLNVRNAFPNPSHHYVTIPFDMPASEKNGEIVISDASGKLIRAVPVTNEPTEITIETTQFPRGTYFYHLQTRNHRSQARKLILN
jgi:hypothetical protein